MSESSRADALERMLAARPEDPRLRFGLAVEYLRTGRLEAGVEALRGYLAVADDEGNAWGRLADALVQLGRRGEAREALAQGIEAALAHGHPSLADELRGALDHLQP